MALTGGALLVAGAIGPSKGSWRAVVLAATVFAASELLVDYAELGWRLRWVLVALLVVCWIIRRELARVLVVILLVFNFTTILQARWPWVSPVRNDAARSDLPVLVHLVLDSHEGLDALPTLDSGRGELRASLLADYESRGFRVFGQAYSRYFDTKNSLGNMFNLSAGREDLEYFRGKDSPKLLRNEYFDSLVERGYRLFVLQSSYVDFCASVEQDRSDCRTYAHGGLAVLHETEAGGTCKAVLLERMLLQRSSLVDWLRRKRPWAWTRLAELNAQACRERFPGWFFDAEPPVLASSTGLEVLERVRLAARQAAPGTVVFAHVILPHSPFFFREDCSQLPGPEWLDSTSRPPAPANDAASAEERSARYLGQVRCLHRSLANLLDELDRRSDPVWVVLHGDHGSRIVTHDPIAPNFPHLTGRDLLHAFSSWYAVKAPHLAPGYDGTLAPLEELLRDTVVVPKTPRAPPTAEILLRRPPERELVAFEIREWSSWLSAPMALEPAPPRNRGQ